LSARWVVVTAMTHVRGARSHTLRGCVPYYQTVIGRKPGPRAASRKASGLGLPWSRPPRRPAPRQPAPAWRRRLVATARLPLPPPPKCPAEGCSTGGGHRAAGRLARRTPSTGETPDRPPSRCGAAIRIASSASAGHTRRNGSGRRPRAPAQRRYWLLDVGSGVHQDRRGRIRPRSNRSVSCPAIMAHEFQSR
jgi:hypothetical protein